MSSSPKKKTRRFEPKFLPPDLWHEVLARLPAKTLLRFRCVCKSFCSIIDSPDFTYMHRTLYNKKYNHPNNNNTVLSCVEAIRDRLTGHMTCKFTLRSSNTFSKKIVAQLCEISLSKNRLCARHYSKINPRKVRASDRICVLGSCHGLWLIEHNAPGFTGQRVQRRVLNPFIRKSIEIPPPPHLINVSCVLGFAPATNDYKIVSFSYESKVSKVSVSVYSLAHQKWIQCGTIAVSSWILSAKLYTKDSHDAVIFVEKAAYWFEGGPNKYDRTQLMSFDFDMEQLSVCELPDDAMENMVARFVFDLNDSLAILSMSSETCRVWILEKDRDKASPWSWRLWKSADTNVAAYHLIIEHKSNLPGKILYLQKTDTFFIEVNLEKLISYNMLNQQFEFVRKKFFGSVDACFESLVSHRDPQWKDCDIHPVTLRKNKRQKQVLVDHKQNLRTEVTSESNLQFVSVNV